LCIISVSTTAQTISFKGIVKETLSDTVISNAIVEVFSYPNKTYITKTQTQKNGTFELNLSSGKYIIKIAHTKNFIELNRTIEITENELLTEKPYEFRIISISPPKTVPQTKKIKSIQIKGEIKDKNNNTPLSNVTVHIIDHKTRNIIKSYNTVNGVFVFHLPRKNYGLKISSQDYHPVSKWIIINEKATTVDIPTLYLEPVTSKKINPGIFTETGSIQTAIPSHISKQDKSAKTIRGIVIDAQTNEPVSYAPITVLDSINKYVKGSETNALGWFSLELVNGEYTIDVKMLGYKKLSEKIKITDKNHQSDSLRFKLDSDAILLSEATVTAKVPNIQVKGDTLEYWAGAYTKDRDILLQDILRNIPGISISSEGILTINNKPVNKILIDGKEFFGNDIQMALKNIPSEMIHKLHVYNKQSDMAELMGVKETSDNQVLDLELKDEFKNSIFGNVQAGYGSDNRYYHKFMVNKLSEKNQLSILGNMNNINNDEYGMGMDSDSQGLKTTRTLGANFNSEQIKDLKIESNITYNDETERIESNESTESFLSSGNRYTEESSHEEESTQNYKLETSLEWQPQSNFTTHLRIKGAHEDTKSDAQSNLKSYVSKQDTTTESSTYSGRGHSNELSSVLTLGLKLNDKGRNLSLQLNGSIEKGSETGINQSVTTYGGLNDKTLDQKLYNKEKGHNWGGTLSYTEPIGEHNTLYLSYSFNRNRSDRDKNVFGIDDKDTYSIIDSTYTRQYRETTINQSIGLGFQSIRDKYEYYINLNIEPGKEKSIINLGDSVIQDLKQNTINYNGSFRLTYKPQKNTTMSLMYQAMLNKPNTTQLSTDTTTIDNLNKIYGNPNLKASFSNNLNLQYQRSDFETGRFIMVSAGLNSTTNQITEYSFIDTQGNTKTTYKNTNGNWGTNLGFIFSTPFRNEKFRLDNNITTSYNRNTGYMNNEKSITNNFSLNEYFTVNFESDIFQSEFKAEANFNLTKNNLSDLSNKKTVDYGISNFTDIKLPYDISIQNNIGYKYYTGYSGNTEDKDELMWSLSLSKLVLKEKGLLKFYIYDILDQTNDIMRVQKTNQVSDITTNSMRRYFLVSFLYRFSIEKN